MGRLLTEAGGGLLNEAGGALLTEVPPPPFPAAPLDLRGELLLGTTWTDFTTWAYQRAGTQAPVKITRGRPDESAQANPAKCSWQWNNRDGRFSPKNPLSPYYGLLGRNTPVRWSVPAAAPYLRLESLGYAACNDSTAIDVSGSIELRIGLKLTDWQGCILACKWDGGGCWAWGIDPQGQLFFAWYDSGGVYRVVWSSQPVLFAAGDFALAVTMDAPTGTVTFYSSDSIDGTFTQIGTAASGSGGAATTIAVNHGSRLQVGYSVNFTPPQLYGRVYEFRMYDGIAMSHQVLDGTGQPVLDGAGQPVLDGSAGTTAADAAFTTLPAGTTAWTDGQGNAWSLAGGAELSGRDYRFHGELSSQPPKWDVTGADQWVAAQAAGPLRRLQQASNNAMSAMRRAISLQSGSLRPVAYWPMEDAKGASQLGAAIGSYPMTFTASPAPSLASDSTFAASASIPSLNGARLQGQVAPYVATGTWTVRFLLKVATSGDTGTLLRVVTAGGAIVYVNMEAGGAMEMTVYAPDGTEHSTGFFSFVGAATGVWCSVEAQPASGGGVRYSLVTVQPGASSGGDASLTVADETAGAGVVRLVQFAPQAGFSGTVVGHCSVQSAWSSLFTLGQPLNAWTGELAATRYARLAAENGYACRVIGLPAYSAPMGPQGQATLTSLLQECEAADLGMAFEPRQVLALGYRTLASMCNQPAALSLDYAASQPGGVSGNGSDSGLDPTYDDQLSKNDWTVTRGAASGSQGGTWQAQLDDGSPMSTGEPPDGIGDYASTKTVNVATDAQLPDVAGWMVHEGTVDEARWPAIPVNLARPEVAALRDAVAAVDCGDHVTLLNAPDQVLYDPVEQLAYGFTEQLGGFRWVITYNCVPEDAFETGVLDDPVRGRCDTSGSFLSAAAAATAATLAVASSGIPWTTDPADFPFDLEVGGERVTATAATAPAATLGTADGTFESGVAAWLPGGGTVAQVNFQPHSGTYCAQVTASGTAEVTLEPVAADRVAVIQGVPYTAAMWVRAASATGLAPTIWWFDASGTYLSASAGPVATVTAWARLSVTAVPPDDAAYALYGPAWPSPTAAAYFYVDDVTISAPLQQVTVTRAVNSVVKPQAAGADVRLWSAPVFALA